MAATLGSTLGLSDAEHRAQLRRALIASTVGTTIVIATWLYATFHSSLPIAVYIALCAVIGIAATAMLTDYTNKDISAEYVGV